MPTSTSGTRRRPTTRGSPTTSRRSAGRSGRPTWRRDLAARNVARTILVQTRSSVDETAEFLALAEATPFVAGVVGWVDLTRPDVGDEIARLRAGWGGRHLVGIRHQVHDEPDPDWLGRADVRAGIAASGAAGLAYDLLVRPEHLPAAVAVARALPDVRFVVDHLAKPPIASGRLEPWASRMRPLGELDNAWCKISGMVTEADPMRLATRRSPAVRRLRARRLRAGPTPLRVGLAGLPARRFVRGRVRRFRRHAPGPDRDRARGRLRRDGTRGVRLEVPPMGRPRRDDRRRRRPSTSASRPRARSTARTR